MHPIPGHSQLSQEMRGSNHLIPGTHLQHTCAAVHPLGKLVQERGGHRHWCLCIRGFKKLSYDSSTLRFLPWILYFFFFKGKRTLYEFLERWDNLASCSCFPLQLPLFQDQTTEFFLPFRMLHIDIYNTVPLKGENWELCVTYESH